MNRSIYFHYHGLLTDISQSGRAGASLVTRCPLQGKILQKLDASGRLSRRVLEVELPFLQDLSLHDIFRIRTDYEPSITAFRRTLRDCAVEMERASGPAEIVLQQQRVRERIADEGLDDLQQKLTTWKRRSIQDTALLAVPAVLGYMGTPSLFNLAVGAVSLLQATLGAHRHHQEVIHHPSWFILRTTDIQRLKNRDHADATAGWMGSFPGRSTSGELTSALCRQRTFSLCEHLATADLVTRHHLHFLP